MFLKINKHLAPQTMPLPQANDPPKGRPEEPKVGLTVV
jgi:hypothetical protein